MVGEVYNKKKKPTCILQNTSINDALFMFFSSINVGATNTNDQRKTSTAGDMNQSMLWWHKLKVFRVHSSVTDNSPEMTLVVTE